MDIWRWLNSIQFHMLGLAFGVVAALTVVSMLIVNYVDPPTRETVSLHEMTLIAQNLPPSDKLDESFSTRIRRQPPEMQTDSERVLAQVLASRLGITSENIRIRLSKVDRIRAQSFARAVNSYGAAHAGSPILFESFEIGVQRSDGNWEVHKRLIPPLRAFRTPGTTSIYLGFLLIVPLSLWVSAGISKPIKAFAAAADRLGAGNDLEPVPISGPTEIRTAAVALNEMQTRVTRSVAERTAVVAAMAHDLRTPLNSLRFQITAAPHSLRESAEAEILMMEHMINSCLDFVDSEIRPMRNEFIDLRTLLQSLTDELSDMGNTISFSQTERMTVQGDLILLKRLFSNLIGNAIKFATHTDVQVKHENGEAVILIQDDGPGIPTDEISKVMEPFFRGERSRNRETGGFGLGLAIVKTAVDAHNASLILENGPTGGLRAQVRIRAHLSAAPKVAEAAG